MRLRQARELITSGMNCRTSINGVVSSFNTAKDVNKRAEFRACPVYREMTANVPYVPRAADSN